MLRFGEAKVAKEWFYGVKKKKKIRILMLRIHLSQTKLKQRIFLSICLYV